MSDKGFSDAHIIGAGAPLSFWIYFLSEGPPQFGVGFFVRHSLVGWFLNN